MNIRKYAQFCTTRLDVMKNSYQMIINYHPIYMCVNLKGTGQSCISHFKIRYTMQLWPCTLSYCISLPRTGSFKLMPLFDYCPQNTSTTCCLQKTGRNRWDITARVCPSVLIDDRESKWTMSWKYEHLFIYYSWLWYRLDSDLNKHNYRTVHGEFNRWRENDIYRK